MAFWRCGADAAAEVRDPDAPALVQQNIFCFKIAVRDTAGVHESHRKGDPNDYFRNSVWIA
jgi:hypothetical protein